MKSKLFLIGLLVGIVAVFALASTVSMAQDNATLPAAELSNPAAPFIFSHDVAVAKGATAEWRKLEGVAADTLNNKVYFAVTSIGKGMSDTEGDIQLSENPCGAVFAGDLGVDFNVSSLKPVVVGKMDSSGNNCDDNAISAPDNIFVDAKGNLWIGEDSGEAYESLWMWDGSALKRFAVVPEGAEVTGLLIETDGTLFLNIQHPDPMNPYPYNRGTVGVITGFKAGDDFESLPIPSGDDVKKLTLAAGEYQVLGRAGDSIANDSNGGVFGRIINADGSVQIVCDNPDGNMFLSTGTGEGYLYSNWECNPGAVSQVYIKQGADGKWSAIEGQMVDFKSVNGTWNNCNASVTPWNTGLTSEEYPPDVQDEWEGGWLPVKDAFAAHLGYPANPLDYGYIVELKPTGGEDGGIGTEVTKHYVMGRSSKEQAFVLPDNKTAYMGDDGTDRVLYKFVADEAGDLSAGTLYAAKITQDSETLNLEWIELGKGNDADIAAQIQILGATYGS